MHTLLTATVHQHVAADRRRRFRDDADRSRRHRSAVAPDLIRTADLGSSVLPVRSPATAVRVGDIAGAGDAGDVADESVAA